MSVFTHEFPNHAQEFLQYMSIIRHAPQCDRGLGWFIYDIMFRRKAALNERAFATTSIELAPVNETRVDSAIFVTGAMAHRQEISVQSLKGREQTKSIYPTANAISTDLSADVLTYLTPTPIVVTKLEDTLAGHQHTWFVSQLCDNLRYGPELDWRESERLDFQKNCLLPLPIQALSLQIWKTRSPLATWLVHSIPHRFLIFKSPQLV